MTHVRRTDASGVPLVATRITRPEVAARNRRARFPAARCGGVLRIASAADPARPLSLPAPGVSFAAISDSHDTRQQ
jgi:hypothetical protein